MRARVAQVCHGVPYARLKDGDRLRETPFVQLDELSMNCFFIFFVVLIYPIASLYPQQRRSKQLTRSTVPQCSKKRLAARAVTASSALPIAPTSASRLLASSLRRMPLTLEKASLPLSVLSRHISWMTPAGPRMAREG